MSMTHNNSSDKKGGNNNNNLRVDGDGDSECCIQHVVVEVDVIIPVFNAAKTIEEAVRSAMHQVVVCPHHDAPPPTSLHHHAQENVHVYVCCYDDGSTDNSYTILQKLQEEYKQSMSLACRCASRDTTKHRELPSTLLIRRSADGVSRGAGYARNRAISFRVETESSSQAQQHHRFLCMLDSDDVMKPTRIFEQCQYLLGIPDAKTRERTLVGSEFDRDPPDSTWHYAKWANGLSPERLMLERYREVTIIQPTWMMERSWFRKLGGYLEAPIDKEISFRDYLLEHMQKNGGSSAEHLLHPTFETLKTLRVAEDTRFFYAHLCAGGRLHRIQKSLVTYRHVPGQTQSTKTPRRLLLHLRVRAFEESILVHSQWGSFCVWGAGRDGKDFVKALSPEMRKRVACMADVDAAKIATGYYVNREIDVKIPIVHFSSLARDSNVRNRLWQAFAQGLDTTQPGFGHVQKGGASKEKDGREERMIPSEANIIPKQKKRRLDSWNCSGVFKCDPSSLPVVVCVAMYRTGGALEHNVSQIGRREGDDLWHLC